MGTGATGEPKRASGGGDGRVRQEWVVFKKKTEAAPVGKEMDGRDGVTRAGQVVVAIRMNRRRGLVFPFELGERRQRARGGTF